jgi:hypothetical protein
MSLCQQEWITKTVPKIPAIFMIPKINLAEDALVRQVPAQFPSNGLKATADVNCDTLRKYIDVATSSK